MKRFNIRIIVAILLMPITILSFIWEWFHFKVSNELLLGGRRYRKWLIEFVWRTKND